MTAASCPTSSFRRSAAMTSRIYGDGSQTRSFCYVDDLIEAMIRTMNTPNDFTGPINIGNPREFTIRELAEQVIAMTGSRSKLVFAPRCRRTIRAKGSRTSRWPARCSAGNRLFDLKPWPREDRSTTSAAS